MVYKWLKNNLIAPVFYRCQLCLSPTRSEYAICSDCEQELPRNHQHCLVCSLPLTQDSTATLICGQCQHSPPCYTSSHVPFLYATPLKQLIAALKFRQQLQHAPLLAHLLSSTLPARDHQPQCLLPVPLHPQRQRERGFNQAHELARLMAKQLGIPVDATLCQRKHHTPYQRDLGAQQRQKNLRNAFAITRTHAYRHVAIIDDVMTTGSTANAIAHELRKTGVEIIEIWAVARTAETNK